MQNRHTTQNRLKRIYAKVGRLAYGALLPFLGLYMNKSHRRVRVLILNKQKEVLLVKNWLGHQCWTMPGGGIKRGETPLLAAIREVHEETGLQLAPKDLLELDTFPNANKKAPFTIVCFAATVKSQAVSVAGYHRLEMLDVAWFPQKHLPRPHSSSVGTALDLL